MILTSQNPQKGNMLFIVMLAGMILLFTAGASLTISTGEQQYTYGQANKIKSRYVAEAGISRAVCYINKTLVGTSISLEDVDSRFSKGEVLYNNEPLEYNTSTGKQKLGEYHVSVRLMTKDDIKTDKDITGTSSSSLRYILVTSVGYTPSASSKKRSTTTISAVYEMSSGVSRVFDYSYFINNWAWFYGNNIICKGNARSNGSFSMGSYSPEIWGKPRFETSDGIDLIGYIDDNCDGKQNNQDGGIYAWDNIDGKPSKVNACDLYAGYRGQNTTPEVPQLPMPNLTNLDYYEKIAKEKGGSIKIGNTIVCDGVQGDNETKQNLYLEGTYDQPIEINGTVVVRGDVILRGYVTGKGSIYSGRNIYLPQRVLYKNNVGEPQPSNNSEASRENWRERNWEKDMLGLFARENIVMADYTNSTWRSNVQSWMNHPLNQSKEDAGVDKIPNTNDPGENDGKWTVEYDSNGNVIPGSGEDIDGDGKYDGPATLTEFNLSTNNQFYSNHPGWAGNIPAGVTKYSDITYWDDTNNRPAVGSGSQNFPQVDGVLYTNHFLGGYIKNDSYNYKQDNVSRQSNTKNIVFFGSIVSRNESIIYSASKLFLYHDDRLSSDDGKRFNFILPRVWNSLQPISLNID